MSDAKKMGLVPLSHLKLSLDRLFPGDPWWNWELETISETLGVGLDDLCRDKIYVLKVLMDDPAIWANDPVFFIYATDVVNNNVADFQSTPMPTSLEMAYAIEEFKKITGATEVQLKDSPELIDCVSYLLTEEGYSKPIFPFGFIPQDRLTEGQTPTDTLAKSRAIEMYLAHMGNL